MLLGAFMASMDVSTPFAQMPGVKVPGMLSLEEQRNMSTAQTARYMARQIGQRAWSNGKNFALVGAIFASSECVIEGVRVRRATIKKIRELRRNPLS